MRKYLNKEQSFFDLQKLDEYKMLTNTIQSLRLELINDLRYDLINKNKQICHTLDLILSLVNERERIVIDCFTSATIKNKG